MKKLQIAFIGVGSIARRHIENVYNYLTEQGILFTIDVYRSGFGRIISKEICSMIDNQFSISESVVKSYDVVFITNPTALHFATLKKFQTKGKFFFIEKPVFSNAYENLNELSGLNSEHCYVACPLRYNAVIEYVKQCLDLKQVKSVRAISSSYLPDWRPGIDYRECYSAHSSQGGGVDIDLIHEWDYITHLFGNMTSGYCIADKISDLEIDSNDIAIYIAQNPQVTVELHLDYFGRTPIRELQLFTENGTINCDILNGMISFLRTNNTIKFNSERNEYQMKEITHFFDIVFGRTDSDSTIEHAVTVLKYAKGDFI